MTPALHFLVAHPLYSWLLASCVTVILWCVVMAYGESDEQRDVRRKKEARRRTDRIILSLRNEHVEREKERLRILIEERADRVVQQASGIVSKLDTPQRAREAEGLEETEWEIEANGRRIA